METGILTEQQSGKQVERAVYLVFGLLLLPILGALIIEKDFLIFFYLPAVFAAGLVVFPRVCLYLFLLSVSVYYPYVIGRVGVHPYDICMLLMTASIGLDFLLRGRDRIVATRIDKYFLFLIAATIISAIFAYDVSYSIVPCARIIVVFLAFRIIYGFALEMGVRKLTMFYIYHVVALSLLNLVLFLKTGGQTRIFGPAWLAIEIYIMTALPMALAFLLWATSRRERTKFAVISMIIGLALLTTQSRAPMLAVVIALPALLMAGWVKMSGESRKAFMGSLRKMMIPIIIILILAFIYRETLFEGVIGRVVSLIESIKSPKETVFLRIVLWTAALKAFATNPITGVGIGNFKIVSNIVPEMKFQEVWYYISGMSAHNVFLHYMAETGIIGTLAIISLAVANLKIAFQSFKLSLTPSDTQMSAANLIAIVVFCVTIFYMRSWTWGQGGYLMALLFGLSVAWNYTVRQKQTV